ncbi:MAG: hypothetical protein FJ265_02230 [Planctomycetes bacterium]|nr:hypothetical protein [Planctomycetota bacterium]
MPSPRSLPAFLLAFLLATACALAQIPLAPAPAAQPQVTVATHYFYWYHWPTEHFDEPGAPGPEGHCNHFADPQKVSYRSTDWHEQNFAAMASCGIDAALPVYWGAPGAYERPNLAFSRLGLPPMVEALERLAAANTPAPKLGLFYDTSTLANDVRGAEPAGGKADLRTEAGRELFCTTVGDFFAAIPVRHWAQHRGKALVVLYVSAFAAGWDRDLGARLRRTFAQRFPGEMVFLVADASWGDVGQDLTTSWGAALWGAQLHPGVAQIGPGYDDRAVPGRRTPVRERENGAFYAHSWQRAIRSRPELVLIETWNEMHEGTEICPSRELGSQYVDATRGWVAQLRAGLDPGAPIPLRWAEPRPQPDLGWGEQAKGRSEVFLDHAEQPGRALGLRPVAVEDGPIDDTKPHLSPGRPRQGLGSYLYLQVSDHFAFDVDADYELEVARDGDFPLSVEYDSHDPRGVFGGSYTSCRATAQRRDGDWLVETYVLRRARFCNRQNGGADLRFVLPERRAAIRTVRLRALPK